MKENPYSNKFILEACGKLLQVVKACPTDPEAYGELGLIYEDLGQPETVNPHSVIIVKYLILV